MNTDSGLLSPLSNVQYLQALQEKHRRADKVATDSRSGGDTVSISKEAKELFADMRANAGERSSSGASPRENTDTPEKKGSLSTSSEAQVGGASGAPQAAGAGGAGAGGSGGGAGGAGAGGSGGGASSPATQIENLKKQIEKLQAQISSIGTNSSSSQDKQNKIAPLQQQLAAAVAQLAQLETEQSQGV